MNFLSGPGRGVILIKIDFPDDKVIGAIVSIGDRDLMTVETTRGGEQTISTAKYEVTGRGGKGRELMQRGGFTRVVPGEVPVPVINGRAFDDSYVDGAHRSSDSWESRTIPEGEYLMIGDNRRNASDSREWGTVRRDLIWAKVVGR